MFFPQFLQAHWKNWPNFIFPLAAPNDLEASVVITPHKQTLNQNITRNSTCECSLITLTEPCGTATQKQRNINKLRNINDKQEKRQNKAPHSNRIEHGSYAPTRLFSREELSF